MSSTRRGRTIRSPPRGPQRVQPGANRPALVAQAGVVAPSPKGTLLVGAGEGTVIEILRLQEDGRRVLDARAFLAGRPLAAGAAFTSQASA